MSRWVSIAAVDDCPPGQSREVIVEDRVVALFNVEGTFYALDGVCPHQGGPLGEGALTGRLVTCPWHGWQFDVCTGQHRLNAKMVQPRLNVKVEEGRVWAEIE